MTAPDLRDALDDPGLAYLSTAELSTRLAGWSDGDLRARFAEDPWLANFLISVWERDHGRTEVTTYPWHQAYVIVEHCNARCAFCSYWLNEESVLGRDWFRQLQPLIAQARSLVLTGGEPTQHPEFLDLLGDLIAMTDARCFRSVITNGARLPELLDAIVDLPINYCVSINAATAETHHAVMHLGRNALPGILDAISRLKDAGRYISLSYVVTRASLGEVPGFIGLCDDLGVDRAYIRTMNPIDPSHAFWAEYPTQVPSAHPDFHALREAAIAAIAGARIPVEASPAQWDVPVVMSSETRTRPSDMLRAVRRELPLVATTGLPLPEQAAAADTSWTDVGDPYNRSAPMPCDHVYFALQSLSRARNLEPCCFMSRVPGHEAIGLASGLDCLELWNAPAMVALRQRLAGGPLYPMCKVCTYQLGY
jgi:pyruvate-formate lyase-activating enzyme